MMIWRIKMDNFHFSILIFWLIGSITGLIHIIKVMSHNNWVKDSEWLGHIFLFCLIAIMFGPLFWLIRWIQKL